MAIIKPTIETILHIGFGKKDPSWELTENEVQELESKLQHIPQRLVLPPSPELGYGGFDLVNKGNIANIPEKIFVYDYCLTIEEGNKKEYFIDANLIEEWLIKQAYNRGYQI